MSEEINYKNNPLHGLGLKSLLEEIVTHYGFKILHAYLNINCFKTNPSIESSVKFLKKTDWAREKVEAFYLYQYKNLPKASPDQYALAPRDRIIPDHQVPGEPAELSLEDAERLHEKRALRAEQRKQDKHSEKRSTAKRKPVQRNTSEMEQQLPKAKKTVEDPTQETGSKKDPWAKWR